MKNFLKKTAGLPTTQSIITTSDTEDLRELNDADLEEVVGGLFNAPLFVVNNNVSNNGNGSANGSGNLFPMDFFRNSTNYYDPVNNGGTYTEAAEPAEPAEPVEPTEPTGPFLFDRGIRF